MDKLSLFFEVHLVRGIDAATIMRFSCYLWHDTLCAEVSAKGGRCFLSLLGLNLLIKEVSTGLRRC